jgi:hypothetical protein
MRSPDGDRAAPATGPRLLDEETVAGFERAGFVVVDGLLTDDELDRYAAAVTAAVADRTRDDRRAATSSRSCSA